MLHTHEGYRKNREFSHERSEDPPEKVETDRELSYLSVPSGGWSMGGPYWSD